MENETSTSAETANGIKYNVSGSADAINFAKWILENRFSFQNGRGWISPAAKFMRENKYTGKYMEYPFWSDEEVYGMFRHCH